MSEYSLYLKELEKQMKEFRKKMEKYLSKQEIEYIQKTSNVTTLTDDELILNRALLAMWYENKKNPFYYDKEEILERYKNVVTEMVRRKVAFTPFLKIDDDMNEMKINMTPNSDNEMMVEVE